MHHGKAGHVGCSDKIRYITRQTLFSLRERLTLLFIIEVNIVLSSVAHVLQMSVTKVTIK